MVYHIGVYKGLQQEIVSDFYSQEDLFDAIVAWIYIILDRYCVIYKYRNNICLDGWSILDLDKKIYQNSIKMILNNPLLVD